MTEIYKSLPGTVSASVLNELWQLFKAIDETWGNTSCRAEDMASRWREFVKVKASGDPSYLAEYENACDVIAELRGRLGDDLYPHLFFELNGETETDSSLGHLKRFVIDEFIRVWVNSGGFRSFGGRNYAGFVSGSRFRTQSPYRTYEEA